MATVTLGGTPFQLTGELPTTGVAPDFTYVKSDLSNGKFSEIQAKAKILISVPSMGTSVCQKESRKFNEAIGARDGAMGLVISKDLPFATNSFCEIEGIENVSFGSDFRAGEFSKAFNAEIADGPFGGLHPRAVWVVDANNNIVHSELVTEIGDEPDYEAALKAVDALL